MSSSYAYGKPALLAIQAIGRRLQATLAYSLRRALALHVWLARTCAPRIAFGSALLAFALLVVGYFVRLGDGNDLFGHHQAQRELIDRTLIPIVVGDRRPSGPIVDNVLLSDGHRCAAHTNIVAKEDAAMCIAVDGMSRVDSKFVEDWWLGEAWSHRCCTEVDAGSENEPIANMRRLSAFVRDAGYMGPIGGLGWLVLLGMFIFAATFAVVLAFTPLTAAYVLATNIAAAVVAVGRLFSVAVKTSNFAEYHPWTPFSLQGRAVLAQVSDCHISREQPYELLVDPGEFSGDVMEVSSSALRSRMEHVLDLALALKPRVLAMTGDMSDRGTVEEFSDVIEIARNALHRCAVEYVVAVAGNHDVALAVAESPDIFLEQRREREIRFDKFQRELQGLGIESPEGGEPLSMEINVDGEQLLIVGLNSCNYASRFLLSNAIGQIGARQLDALDRRLGQGRGPVIILMHHHLSLPSGRVNLRSPIASMTELMKLPIDGDRLVETLLTHSRNRKILVLHGHQHELLQYVIRSDNGGEVRALGLPSSTLGCSVPTADNRRRQLDGKLYFAMVGYDANVGFSVEIHRHLN